MNWISRVRELDTFRRLTSDGSVPRADHQVSTLRDTPLIRRQIVNNVRRALSLAEINAGDEVRIRAVLFDSLRFKYSALGVEEGAMLRCVDYAGDRVTVATASGARVEVPREHARFVEVRPT